jgi:hypothetical protein
MFETTKDPNQETMCLEALTTVGLPRCTGSTGPATPIRSERFSSHTQFSSKRRPNSKERTRIANLKVTMSCAGWRRRQRGGLSARHHALAVPDHLPGEAIAAHTLKGGAGHSSGCVRVRRLLRAEEPRQTHSRGTRGNQPGGRLLMLWAI